MSTLKAATTLANTGDYIADNFEGNERSFAFECANPALSVVTDESGIGESFGKALQVEFKDGQNSYNLATFTNYTLKAGGSYRVTFDYKVLVGDAANQYAVALVRWDDYAAGYPNATQGFWVGAKSTEVQQFDHTFTLTGDSDGWLFSLSNWAANINATILIDNLKIEKV